MGFRIMVARTNCVVVISVQVAFRYACGRPAPLIGPDSGVGIAYVALGPMRGIPGLRFDYRLRFGRRLDTMYHGRWSPFRGLICCPRSEEHTSELQSLRHLV